MALPITGQLAAVNVSTLATLTDIYTVPTASPARAASVNITITNRADVATLVRIAHIKNDVAANVALEDYIMYDFSTASLASNRTPFGKDGVLMEEGDTIAVLTNDSAVTVQVNGIEEDT